MVAGNDIGEAAVKSGAGAAPLDYDKCVEHYEVIGAFGVICQNRAFAPPVKQRHFAAFGQYRLPAKEASE